MGLLSHQNNDGNVDSKILYNWTEINWQTQNSWKKLLIITHIFSIKLSMLNPWRSRNISTNAHSVEDVGINMNATTVCHSNSTFLADNRMILTVPGMIKQYSAPSHYLNQCWVTVNWTLGNKLQRNQDTKFFIHKNAFEMVVNEMAAILSRGRWFKPWMRDDNLWLLVSSATSS